MNTWTVETLRAFEEEVRDVYLQGRIRAPVHLSRGNEKHLIEIFKEVRPNDWVFSNYRSHYHALLKGIPREQVMAAILEGHSIHLEFPDQRFYTSAIVAGCLPIALGTALGIKRRGGTEKVWCFCGDMASFTGAFEECSIYAYGFHLPVIFVIECNDLSTNTPTSKVWGNSHLHILDNTIHKGTQVWSYCYDREGWPHVGAGAYVQFDRDEVARSTPPGWPARWPAQERSDVMG